ncbi:MAG: TatD family hydrolase [Desulfomonilia bacterium]|nr:TatD family hydrolase [Desulfomonilia bacterium]
MSSVHAGSPVIADAHNHLHFRAFSRDLDDVIVRAREQGVLAMLTVSIDENDAHRAIHVAGAYPGVYASLGIHPQNAGIVSPKDVLRLARLHNPGRTVAVGETGFDLYRTPESKTKQRELFLAHISLARQLELPLIIHDRNAHEETVAVLDETQAWALGGVFHCFSGDTTLAKRVISEGFFVSVPGVVTYKNATVIRQVVSQTPEEFLLVETDAPYLSPEPFRGKRNEPAHIRKTLEVVASLKGTTPENMAMITTENFNRLFLEKTAAGAARKTNPGELLCSSD